MNEIVSIGKKPHNSCGDAAQSFGSSLNKKCRGLSKVATFSLNPMKPLGGLGEGGFCVTNNSIIAEIKKISLCWNKI